MTNGMRALIMQSDYLVDYEARNFTKLDHKKSLEEIYEQLCNDGGLNEPYALDVQDFDEWVNETYSALEILEDNTITMDSLKEEYRQEVIDPAIEEVFTDSEYFAWL